MNDIVVQTTDLVRRFGRFTAVDGLNLAVRRGEIYGFLGPNGAGKTTTLLLLLGILRPTAGRIEVFGRPLAREAFAIKRRVGVVTEYGSFYDEMTALEYLRFFGRLYRVDDADARAQALLERLDLWRVRDGLVGSFSTGMRKKLAFARALLHRPDLLLLDEPVSGLDPRGILQARELIIEARAAGATILISSHVLSEVEITADRVGILTAGRLVAEDTMANLGRRVGGGGIEVELAEVSDDLLAALAALTYVRRVERDGARLTVYTDGAADYRADLGKLLSERRSVVLGMRAVTPSLEDVFMTITEAQVDAWTGGAHHHVNGHAGR